MYDVKVDFDYVSRRNSYLSSTMKPSWIRVWQRDTWSCLQHSFLLLSWSVTLHEEKTLVIHVFDYSWLHRWLLKEDKAVKELCMCILSHSIAVSNSFSLSFSLSISKLERTSACVWTFQELFIVYFLLKLWKLFYHNKICLCSVNLCTTPRHDKKWHDGHDTCRRPGGIRRGASEGTECTNSKRA